MGGDMRAREGDGAPTFLVAMPQLLDPNFKRAVVLLIHHDEEGTFEQVRALEQPFEDLLHSFADHDKVIDVRNFGLMGAIELASREGAPGARGLEIHKRCFWEENLIVRNGMDCLQFSPFLNSDSEQMTRSFEAGPAV